MNTASAEDEVELRFVSFPKSADPKPVELVVGEGKTIKVNLPTNSISEVYKVKPLAQWALGKTTKDDEGEPTFEAYGRAPSINSKKQLILVIRSGASDAEGLKLIPMDYSTSNFSGGSYFVMNAAKIDIAGAIGTGKFSLKPRDFVLIKPKPTKVKDEREYCFARFLYRNGKNIQPFFSATWRFNRAARSMVFFYHDAKTKHLRVHTIRNYIK